MTTILLTMTLVLALAAVILLILVLRRCGQTDLSAVQARFDTLEKLFQRSESTLSAAVEQSRQASLKQGGELRIELQGIVNNLSGSLVQSVNAISEAQQKQLTDFSGQLNALKQSNDASATALRAEVAQSLDQFRQALQSQINDMGGFQKQRLDSFAAQISNLIDRNEKKFDELRAAVETKLANIQADNAAKLEEMRRTVDEKLQGTLEKRLGQSFQLVSERLEQVHKGLGEMQTLAAGVGDLKKVLTNVKTRGTWGEVQLGNLLEQVLAPAQYARNVKTKPTGRELVEFALRLPGRSDDRSEVWLPIDAKFPKEDYERLVEAAERSDAVAVEQAARDLEARVRSQARDIRDKYIEPPYTTDFGLLYLPTEGLYAEVLRRPGLADSIQRDYRVVIAGPTTLAALLNSLQMGFRTLAIQQRSSEVWKILGAVKTEFGKFGDTLEKVKKKLDETGTTLDEAAHRSRQLERKLRTVEALPIAESAAMLVDGADSGESSAKLKE